MQFINAICNLHETPSTEAQTTSQGLFGEAVDALKTLGPWTKVSQLRDGYSGYVQTHQLGAAVEPNTHWVSAPSTPVFRDADIKSYVLWHAQFGSELQLTACENEDFLCNSQRTAFIWKEHLKPLHTALNGDLLSQARRLFMSTPYVWGGRSPAGVDCSGLVQSCAFAIGVNLPRDSHQQEAALNSSISYGQQKPNDLLFWPGHVAIAIDKHRVLHATAHSLNTCEEALSAVELRAGKPSSIKRLTT